jgi:hypothetical protein
MATKMIMVLLVVVGSAAFLHQGKAAGLADEESFKMPSFPKLPKVRLDEDLIADILSDLENLIGEVDICTKPCKTCLLESATSCVGLPMQMILPCAVGFIATTGCLTMG